MGENLDINLGTNIIDAVFDYHNIAIEENFWGLSINVLEARKSTI
jgi:hypothetical protein